MKKSLLFAFAILFATASMAQNHTMLLQESFNNSSIPTGWSATGVGTSNWKISNSNYAGGTPYELWLDWQPQFNGISRMVLPAVDLTGLESVAFSFKHYVGYYSGATTLGVATSSDGGTTWNTAWSEHYNSSGAHSMNLLIETPDVGQPNVQFCIYYQGNSYNYDYWLFDDIEIYVPEDLDIVLTKSNVQDIMAGSDVYFELQVLNKGYADITSVEATYTIEGREPVTETFDTQIALFETTTLSFVTPTNLDLGDYNIEFSIDLVNGTQDDNTTNNTLSKSFSIVSIPSAEKIPMFEHFSSSTCGPCVSLNSTMHTFCNNNPGRFTYTKYQMNWPGAGDPYYTAEGGTRRSYYGVDAVPTLFLDGDDISFSESVFDQYASKYAFVDIKGSFFVEGNVINVIADIMPFVDANVRVYVSVNEKVTSGNVGSNGETKFYHVFMKMLPNAQGTTVSLQTGELQRLEFTQDLSSTHVEEMSDLEVAIWVQNYSTKEVLNSRFAYEYTSEHPYPVENLVLSQNEDAATNTIIASWEAPSTGNPIGYNVYVNNRLVSENQPDLSYEFSGELGLIYLVDVQAVYGNDDERFVSVKTSAFMTDTWSVDENSNTLCKLYPNPASSNIRIEAQNAIESVKVYNVLGALVETISANGNNVNVNLSQYSNGVYLFNIRQSDGTVSNQRVVVSH